MKHIFRWFAKITGIPSALLFFKPKIYYEDKKVQSTKIKGKAIIAANHKGPMEYIFFMLVFWRRYLRCIVSEAMYDSRKITRFFLKALGAIRTDRNIYDMQFVATGTDILNKGGVIEIFPEAMFNTTSELKPFKMSTIYLSLNADAPIIPVYHMGVYGLFKRSKLIIGKPIYASDLIKHKNPSLLELSEANRVLENKMLELKTIIEANENNAKTKKVLQNIQS